MPSTNFDKLEIGDIKPKNTILQKADKSVKHQRVFIEYILVKVGKFLFLVGFYVLDMVVDREISIILGRLFLAIVGAVIDVKKGELKRVKHGEESLGIYDAR